MNGPEFDNYSSSYEELLRDPIRDGFAGSAAFFHVRKRDLIREYFRRQGTDTRQLRYLDVGCGQGELASLLCGDFAETTGCDPSEGMLRNAKGIQTRVQKDPGRLPFDDGQFDFITAVCVYHHIRPEDRPAMTAEVARVLRPGGVFVIIEHNPWNPATRLIVSRTPVDADAILLSAAECRRLFGAGGFEIDREQYFLFLPERIYSIAAGLEIVLQRVPLGGQYAVFGRRR